MSDKSPARTSMQVAGDP
ncbi:hypothetical protein CJF31_00011401 [Rutstroemia sp. NJR-2017a BVV2]|nr:hypothetical protein CJF31_00011401 [Rutstroemia sp. NJR-2017a BVV2]